MISTLISVYCCFSTSLCSCGSLIADLAVKFTSFVTEDRVLEVFRTATKGGTLGEFSVNTSSLAVIAPDIQTTAKPPDSTTTSAPDGTFPLLRICT